ncbi:hypothetical protein [Caballeronia novacaledonica]|uniref:Uncharacterized protein n=1 Tax=Caballeronia novacaledonica TaxID=1544861 RepID=A0AA37IEA1_9BURK|nr:hypothetical protein [Caballeronia novacaledonica]GJH27144.1 hypothetical protein CBA19CS42_21530 [Caballeronia novacaledonica]
MKLLHVPSFLRVLQGSLWWKYKAKPHAPLAAILALPLFRYRNWLDQIAGHR